MHPIAKPKCVEIDLDRTRIWQFDPNAYIALSSVYGPNPLKRFSEVFPATESEQEERSLLEHDAERIRMVRDLIWCGLVSDDAGIKPEDVGRMLSFGGMAEGLLRVLPVISAEAVAMRPPKPETEKESEAIPAPAEA